MRKKRGFLIISLVFFVVSLCYILTNANYKYEQGGIGVQGIIAVCLFYISLIETLVISFLYHHKLKHSSNELVFNKVRLVSAYTFLYSFIFLLSSVAFRADVCVNGSVNIWKYYGTFIIILATVIFSVFIRFAITLEKEKTLRNLSIALLLLVSLFTVSNYYILQSSVVIGDSNMWTIILGTIFIIIGVIVLRVGEKKNYSFTFFQLFTFLGFAFYAIGLIYHGCSMILSIPHFL